ncbi:MAG TPA: response regulator transcription factor [Actinomycetota bacterium]|nr:response regulator transcription factor [Actinomycetota bacterium]
MRQLVRVVLADDHDAFVEGLGMVLSAEADLEVVALAGDGTAALQAVVAYEPDVLVVDTQMPGPSVAELVRLVGQARPATRVLLLAEDTRRPANGRVAAPSAHAGTTRAVSARELAAAIRAVAEGREPPAAPVAAAPEPRPATAAAPVHVVAGRDDHAELLLRSLSERERQILRLLARGYSNRRIAESCYLSINTVRTHVQNVLIKLGVHSKLEAVALAVRRGLVTAGNPPAGDR